MCGKTEIWSSVFHGIKTRHELTTVALPDPPNDAVLTSVVAACSSAQEKTDSDSSTMIPFFFPSAMHSSFHWLNIASLKTHGNRGRAKDRHVYGGGGERGGYRVGSGYI